MSKRKLLTRAGWLFMALTFLLSGVVLVVILAVQSSHQNNKPSANQTSACQTDTKLIINQPPTTNQKLASFTPIGQVDKPSCIDIKKGDGLGAQVTDTVTVQYTGALAKDGTIFESSLDSGQPVTLSLFQVITGWSEGLPGMQAGGTRRLVIPAAKAYGPAGACKTYKADQKTCDIYSIPPNADLVFDIQLLKIGQ